MIWLICLGLLVGDPPSSTPSWYLESIEWISANHASESLLTVHSRLQPGREYDEQELSQAMVRIQQLPWIVSARFALRKGQKRHQYRLEITLEETRSFFLDVTAQTLHEHSRNSEDLYQGLAGYRHFFGRYAMAYGSLTPSAQGTGKQNPNGTSARLGLSYFNFLDKGVFLDLQWSYREKDQIAQSLGSRSQVLEYRPMQTATLALGYPIARHQWLRSRFHYEMEETRVEQVMAEGSRSNNLNRFRTNERRRRLSLFWERTTTNDSWLPTRGHTLRGGTSVSDGNSNERYSQTILNRSREWDTSGVFADGQIWRPLTQDFSFYVGGEGSYETTREINDANNVVNLKQKRWGGRAGLLFFGTRFSQLRLGDWALGLEIGGHGTDTETRSQQLDNLTLFSPLRENHAELFLTFRNSWFIGRFSIRFEDRDQKTIFRKGGPLP